MTFAVLSPPSPRMQRNFGSLYGDVFGYGILAGSTLAFLSVYCARLGATNFELGLLTAAPAAVNLVVSLPGAHWLQRQSLAWATFWTSVWNRAFFLPMVFLPVLLPTPVQVWVLILLTVLLSVPGTLIAIAFNALFADVVPPERRGLVVGRRNVLLAISLILASVACGLLLDRVAFPLNYQIVFALGALGAAISSYFLGKIRVEAKPSPPRRGGGPPEETARPGLMRSGDGVRTTLGLRFFLSPGGEPLLRLDLLRGPLGSFFGVLLVFYTFQYLPVPLFPLFWVRDLKLTDGAISLGNILFYGVMLLASLGLARASARYGHRRILFVSAIFYSLYPLLTAAARGPALFFLASVLGGGVWAFLNGGLVNRLMERVPEDSRPASMALYNVALNIGILAGSLLGPIVGDFLGLRRAILLAAGLRMLAGCLLALRG